MKKLPKTAAVRELSQVNFPKQLKEKTTTTTMAEFGGGTLADEFLMDFDDAVDTTPAAEEEQEAPEQPEVGVPTLDLARATTLRTQERFVSVMAEIRRLGAAAGDKVKGRLGAWVVCMSSNHCSLQRSSSS